MNRFYAAEPTPSITGSNADHRLPVASHEIYQVAETLATLLGGESASVSKVVADWVAAAARDLHAHPGGSIVIAGETQPPEVHALVARMNDSLGNVGATIRYCAPIEARPLNQTDSVKVLVEEMRSGAVNLLVMLGGDPVYDAPVDLDFGGALQRVAHRVHHTLQANETSRLCDWQIPATHFLESWSDLRAYEGTVTIVQPLIEPLYRGISVHEMLEALIGNAARPAYDLVRATWQAGSAGADFEAQWRQVLSDGKTPGIGGAVMPENSVGVPPAMASPVTAPGLEVVFRADPNLLDGRYANNGWLQELPKPFSKLTWDNAALISPILARREKLTNGDYVELNFRGES